jgi:DNA repair protein RecO (recombination protein O)
MTHKTRGVVIKRMNYGEADRILTILTEDMGKIKAIAKGSRKILSKMGGSLEPFCLVNFIFHQGKSFYIVTSASVEKHFDKVHTDITKTAKAFYIGELLDKFLEEKENHPEVFELFVKYLQALNDDDDEILIPVFSAKILENLGFRPVTTECLHCGNKLVQEQNFWDDVEGGVICQVCHDKFDHGQKIDNDIIKILRLIFSEKFNVGSKINIDDEYKKVTARILESYVEGTIEREIKSRKFMKEVRK